MGLDPELCMRGKRMTIFVGESDQWRHRPLYLAILEHLKAAGCSGATVTRGVAGFGAQSQIHTATIIRLSEDFPVVITAVDATSVTFRQEVTDPLSPVKTREVRKSLYATEEARQ